MTIIVLEKNVVQVLNGTKNAAGGWITPPNSRSRTHKIETDAVHRRKKPVCLNSTPFRFERFDQNPKSYEGERSPAGSYKAGAAYWVYSNSLIEGWAAAGNAGLALARARHKMAGSEFNFGETLVEFGETVDLLSNTAKKIAGALSALKAGKPKRAAHLLGVDLSSSQESKLRRSTKKLSQGWLTLQFGFLPLLNDAYNAYQAYVQGLATRGVVVKKVSGYISKDITPTNFGNLGEKAVVRGRVSNPALRTLNSWGLLNPALMAWNKLPLSFMVDWFYPISTLLGAMTASAGLSCYTQALSTPSGYITYHPSKEGVWDTKQLVYKRTAPIGYTWWIVNRAIATTLGKLVTAVALLRSSLG